MSQHELEIRISIIIVPNIFVVPFPLLILVDLCAVQNVE